MRLHECEKKEEMYYIAEMSGNHGGSLEHALEIVRAAAESGASCLKTQTYTADTITLKCNNDLFLIKEGLWAGRTLYDLYEEAYTPWDWQKEIKAECKRLGLDFLSSVFDESSVDFLEDLGADAYKIASPELIDIPLIRYAASTKKPMIMSTGMGTVREIEEAVEACASVGNTNIVLLKCTAEYPALFEDMNLAIIPDMKRRFGCRVGLSDHSLGCAADVAAAVLGACMIEKHFCITRKHESVDSAFSMEKEEYLVMVNTVNEALCALGEPTYARSTTEEGNSSLRKSIFACKDIQAGEVLGRHNCKIVRPGYGLAPKYYDDLMGKTARRDLAYGEPFQISDIEL